MASTDSLHLPIAALRRRVTAKRLERLSGSLAELETHRQEQQLPSGVLNEGEYLRARASAYFHLDRLLTLDVPILTRFVTAKRLVKWSRLTKRCISDPRPIPDVEVQPHDPFESTATPSVLDPGVIVNARLVIDGWIRQLYHEIGPRVRVFVAAATEGQSDVESLASVLRPAFDVEPWFRGRTLPPGGHLADSLQRTARDFDFGVFFLRPEDKREKRGRNDVIPRDNVVFELGLFMGISSLGTAFALVPRTGGVQLPADLAGIIYLGYDSTASDRTAEFVRVGSLVAQAIETCIERHL